jgi:hypothetical protein
MSAAVYFIAWFLGGVRNWFLEKNPKKISKHSVKKYLKPFPLKVFRPSQSPNS